MRFFNFIVKKKSGAFYRPQVACVIDVKYILREKFCSYTFTIRLKKKLHAKVIIWREMFSVKINPRIETVDFWTEGDKVPTEG